jgi:hypothetical protein
LLERAKQFAQLSAQIEDRRLPILEKRDAELYNLLKARQDVQMAQATVELQNLRVQEASMGVALAHLQHDRAQLQADHWQDLLKQPISDLERSNLDLLQNEARTQMIAYGVNQTAATASAFSISNLFSSGSDSLSKTGTALSTLASALGTQANINATRASYERRSEDWQYQHSLAQQDVRIGAQSVAAARAQAEVRSQERVIAQLGADHAAATVDFLTNKFTNVDLYDWMSGVLEQVHRFFLQQATSIAKLAEETIAFMRQAPPAGIIQDDYWRAPGDSSGTGGT